MAETQSTNLKLDLVDGDSLFDTGKVKSNFEKIDTAVGSLTENNETRDVTVNAKVAISGVVFSDTSYIQIKNGIAFVEFSLKTSEAGKAIILNDTIGMQGNIVTGLPKPKRPVLTYGDKFGFTASRPETIRFRITTDGIMVNHYNDKAVMFDNNPASFYVSYPTDD